MKTPDDKEEQEHNRRQHEEAERHKQEEERRRQQEQGGGQRPPGSVPGQEHLRPGQPPGQPANVQGQPQPHPEAQRRPQAEPGGSPQPPGSPPGIHPDALPESTGRYRLLAPHVIENVLYETGTEVGTDTGVPYALEPSTQMEGVDDASRERINKRHQVYYGKDAPWHDEKHPEGRRRERDREELDKQREEEKGQEPVSHQQAFERGKDEFKGEKITGPPPAPRPVMNKGGDTSPGMGPATPDIREEDIRPHRPLEDQLPK